MQMYRQGGCEEQYYSVVEESTDYVKKDEYCYDKGSSMQMMKPDYQFNHNQQNKIHRYDNLNKHGNEGYGGYGHQNNYGHEGSGSYGRVNKYGHEGYGSYGHGDKYSGSGYGGKQQHQYGIDVHNFGKSNYNSNGAYWANQGPRVPTVEHQSYYRSEQGKRPVWDCKGIDD